MKDVVTVISVSLLGSLKTRMLDNLTFMLSGVQYFSFFSKFGQNLGCVLYMGAHYTRVNTVYTIYFSQFISSDNYVF